MAMGGRHEAGETIHPPGAAKRAPVKKTK